MRSILNIGMKEIFILVKILVNLTWHHTMANVKTSLKYHHLIIKLDMVSTTLVALTVTIKTILDDVISTILVWIETRHWHTVVQEKNSIRNRHSANIQIMHVCHVALSVTDVNENVNIISYALNLHINCCELFQYCVYVVFHICCCVLMTGEEKNVRMGLMKN